jgi:hypothetical protein
MKRRFNRLAAVATAVTLALGTSAPAQNGPQYSHRCFTPQFWCGLPQPLPLGSRCFCNTPYGPIYGIVR